MSEEEKIAFIVDMLERGNYDEEWPEDEREAYREFRWAEGWKAVNVLRAKKILKVADAGFSLTREEADTILGWVEILKVAEPRMGYAEHEREMLARMEKWADG